MTTGKARMISLRGLAKIGVVLCCGLAYASPVGDAIGPYVDGGELPGAVSVVVDAKGKATVDCRGYADLEAKTPMRPDSLFWLASNTKAIAAATLMTLVDEGKVNLDDPVSKYLPEFADVKVAAKDGPRAPVRPMTVRMTLSHMSGLPFFPGMPIDKRPIAELAHLAATTPLAADPGERYAYSNWGIDVAMAVVEKVTGRSFAAVMKERILDPLGMKDATFVPSEEQMTRLAKSYRLSDNLKPREIKIAQFRYPYTDPTREPEGGGGLFGTADDLCRFFRMLAAGGTAPDGRRILSEQAVREMTRRQTPDRPKITSYGFGLNVKPNCVGHGGAYGTYAAFDPQTKAVRVLCISMSGTTKQRTAFQAAWNKASLAGTAAFLPAAGDVTYRAAPEGVPGAVLVTADADGAPRFECVGEAAPGRRMEPDTVFWMASNTKGVLGALVLNLATEGKLSLDDPVEKYFPSWKNLAATNRPTLRMLLCHTSGLARFPKADLPRPGMEALAERAAEQPLAYEPGTKYVYSNWDIDVAAAITEKVTGRPFDVEMRERILKPLGMTDTTFVPTAEQATRRATVYKLSADKPPHPEEPVRKLVNPYLHIGEHPEAGGGLLSTPQDMIKFFQMIARGGRTPDGKILISEPLMRAWATKQTPPAIKTAYSFGMAVNGKGGISHGGACGTWGEANINTRKARLYMVNFQGKSKASKAFHAEWKRRTELTSAR